MIKYEFVFQLVFHLVVVSKSFIIALQNTTVINTKVTKVINNMQMLFCKFMVYLFETSICIPRKLDHLLENVQNYVNFPVMKFDNLFAQK